LIATTVLHADHAPKLQPSPGHAPIAIHGCGGGLFGLVVWLDAIPGSRVETRRRWRINDIDPSAA